MKKRQNNSARATALQITMAVALVSISAILLASSFKAAQSSPEQSRPQPQTPFVTCGFGNIRVEATNSGNDADYTTLQSAFAAINAGTHTGTVNIGVCGNTTETVSAVLTGAGGYTSISMTPTGPRTISGAIVGALVDLSGATATTINGLNAGGNSLTISNTNTGATTSTIRFINGANNNTVTNCSLEGSSTGAVAAASGTVLISTSTTGANTANTISNNAIGPSAGGLPTKGVTSLGSASPNNNTLNVINNNNIFDFFSATIAPTGISLQTNTTTTTVSNNRLYQTAARTFTGASLTYAGITSAIGTGAGTATITGNRIGFSSAAGAGTTSISGSTNVFVGLNLTSNSTVAATSVQNNTVSGIVQSTASTGTGSASAFRGIFLAAGRYDVGTTTGNNIGSLDGSSGITFTGSSTGAFNAIYDFSSSSNTIANNNIGSITMNGAGTGTGGFRAIFTNTVAAAINTITNNTIGSSAGPITSTFTGGVLYAMQNSTGAAVITGNTIRNMSGTCNTLNTIVVSGMVLTATTTTNPNIVSQNTIHSLSNNSGGISNSIYALYCSFPTSANIVERNVVHSLTMTSAPTSSQLVGILPVAGSGTYRNNMVRLGVDAAGASITDGFFVFGFFEIAGVNNLYFNSAYIGGTGVAAVSNTYGFVSNVTTGTRNYVDNIFYNARSNASGAGNNYAISLLGMTGVTSNRNDLYVSGTGGFVGQSPGPVDQLTLANWQTATGQDANSISADPLFIDPNGTARPGPGQEDTPNALVNLHINAGSPCIGAGAAAGGITSDIDGDLRNPVAPDIGADERTSFTGGNVAITKTADAASVPFGNPVGFVVKLNNTFPGTTTGLSVTDALPAATGVSWSIDGGATDAGWSVSGSPPTQSLVYSPTTLAGNTMTQAHVVSSTTSNTCGASLNNMASFTSSNGGNGNASASIGVTNPSGTKIFTELFDGETPPALPAGWAASNPVSNDAVLWVTSSTGVPTPVADTAPNSAYINNPATVNDKVLDSPVVPILSTNAQLTFRRNHAFETSTLPNTWDGGVLEISIGGGAFTDILAAGGSFVTGGYNAVVNPGFMNPLAGRSAWGSTTTGAFVTTTVNLPASAFASNVKLRWRMGSDNSGSGSGWRVDGISITDFPCPGATPTPAPTASPTPSPTASPTPTATVPPPDTVCVLVEGFDNVTTLIPGGWVMQNNSQPGPGTNPSWAQGSTATFVAHSAPGYISANYNNGTGVSTLSNWLLTPPVTLKNNARLRFWTRTVSTAFPDRLQVRMSTNGTSANVGGTATSVGDFTTLLLDINPTYGTAYPIVFQEFTVILSGLGSPVKGRLAFRYFVENGGPSGDNSNYIGIDTMDYDCDFAGPTPTPTPPPPTPTPTPSPTPTPCPIDSPVLSQNFESGFGAWTVDNVTTGSACPLTADWTVRPNPYDPSSAGCGGSTLQTPLNSAGGTQFAMADSDAAGSGSSVNTRLNSPSFNTVGLTTLRLNFRHHYRPLGSSVGVVEVSTAGAGGPWTSVRSYSTLQGAQAAFVAADAVILDSFVGNPDVRIRFRYTAGWDWWWAIDDIVLSTCGGATADISGTITYCSGNPLPGATMTRTGFSGGVTATNGAGFYSFTGLTSGQNYVVTPTKTALTPGADGIDGVDVLAVTRHFLNLGTPLAGCRLAAADVNGDTAVTGVDSLAVQRFFLGNTTGTANSGQYQFTPTSRSYTPLSSTQTGQDYAALNFGDVAATFVHRPQGDQDVVGAGEVTSTVAAVALPEARVDQSKGNLVAAVTTSAIDAKSNLVGFQGDFTFDERVVTFQSEPVQKAGLTAGNWNVVANVLPGAGPVRTLRVLGYALDASTLSGEGTLFNLNMASVNKAGSTQLIWAPASKGFVFIDADLKTQKPGNVAPGSVSPQPSQR